ncbi:LADA_0E11122g1_1 [Lachancea dasiensis]|uniref:U3 small nucleolar RNA-associated protein 25 n=1 Tax=Lachancea dasiensis TaxID=1072105 RepID=A0A1G4JER1_9SACH|nr:LADA_0E11122g1_1 [Lachancea dasiensis]
MKTRQLTTIRITYKADSTLMKGVKRSKYDQDSGLGYKSSKGGRKQLRTIRKTGGKNNRHETSDEANNDASDELKQPTSAAKDGSDALHKSANEAGHQREAYTALLTLLKTDHSSMKNDGTKSNVKNGDSTLSQKPAWGGEAEDEEEDEELAIENALVDQQDDDDDNDLGDSDMANDDETLIDTLESHFNSVPDKVLDDLDAAFKVKSVRYRSGKSPVGPSQEYIYSRPALPKDPPQQFELPERNRSISPYFVKQKLKVQNDLLDPSKNVLTELQKELVDPIFQYQDLLYEYSGYEQESEYRDLYALHVLNHVYKTRDRILKNNQRLQENPDQEILDQGFTRPKVLIVVPTRDTAHKVLTKIIEKSGIDQVDKKGKFQDQFFQPSATIKHKPKSFQHVFQGNTNDFFVLGVKFTRKAIKLYSNFYQSDIIVCSPLGLQLILENTDKKKRQDDFLSSIELLVIDQLHSIEFQNVLHLSSIFEHLNKIPQQQHDADFSRIRMWYINDQAKLLRQSLIFTRYSSPFANSLINGKCKNYAGRWKNHTLVSPDKSSLGQLGMRTRLIFQRFDLAGNSAIDEPDYRFKYFCSVIVSNIVKSTGYEDGILLYIPDYTDFIRVRNYLREKTSILFGDINEYSEQRQLTANRALFDQGRTKVLLYTERLHHFRRYEIKGVKTVIFYKPPTNPEFFEETVRFLGKSAFLGVADLNISVVRCLYSKLDGLALERIVGTERAAVLTRGPNETYEFK